MKTQLRNRPHIIRIAGAAMVVAACVLVVGAPVLAERPTAPKLLPKKTLAYIRVADGPDLVKRMDQTAGGRMVKDEKIRPLVSQLYGFATQAFQQIQERIGVGLTELLSLPQGEICVAVVGRDEGAPALVAVIDVGQKIGTARKLLEAVELQAVGDGAVMTTEKVGDVTLNVFNQGKAVYCERESTILFSTSVTVIKQLLATWDGTGSDPTLADNREFTSIMSRSVGTKDERPQVTFFVDPIELFRNIARNNAGAQFALAMLPTLGLDGIKAAGGGFIVATEQFDSISHLHLLLDNPREGVLRALAMESGDTDPESWVPVNAASYMTVNWNVDQTVQAVRELVEMLRGPGTFDDELKRRLSDNLGVDVQKDVIGQLAGRFTHVSWFEKEARVNAGTNLVGVKLKDTSAFRKTLDTMISRAGPNAQKNNYRGIAYYSFAPRRQPPPNFNQELLRLPTPCVGVVGDYLLLSDSDACLKAAIDSKKNPNESLSDELDFKLVASRIRAHLGSQRPGMIVFQRPEESMRSFYELANSPSTHRALEEASENNPLFRALHQVLKDNPLPPFSVIAKYLAPAGGMMVSDQSGIHYIAFSLKRD